MNASTPKGPVTPEEVAGWISRVYRKGAVPGPELCAHISSYLTEVLAATGGSPLSTQRPKPRDLATEHSVAKVIDTIGQKLAHMQAPGSIQPNAFVPRLQALQNELVQMRHLIEAPDGAEITRPELDSVIDTLALYLLTALQHAGRRVSSIGNNAMSPPLRIMEIALDRIGHAISAEGIGNRLTRDSSRFKMVSLARRKSAQVSSRRAK